MSRETNEEPTILINSVHESHSRIGSNMVLLIHCICALAFMVSGFATMKGVTEIADACRCKVGDVSTWVACLFVLVGGVVPPCVASAIVVVLRAIPHRQPWIGAWLVGVAVGAISTWLAMTEDPIFDEGVSPRMVGGYLLAGFLTSSWIRWSRD